MSGCPLHFAFAYGAPNVSARFRVEPEDFRVDEDLGFEPSGEGEHIYLQLRKRGQNTLWLAGQIARFCGVRNLDVGYCGLKDRHAVTTQWFSVYRPKGSAIDWSGFQPEGMEILDLSWHSRKLKPGAHAANRFAIRLRDLSAPVAEHCEDGITERLKRIPHGVPNYFGEQRFGIKGGNLEQAQKLLVEREPIRNRKQRGLIISAARAYLFNLVLSERVARGTWQQHLLGDPGDSPSGPLWGRGRAPVSGQTAELEGAVLDDWRHWCEGLEHVGLQQERRALLCQPRHFVASREAADLCVAFTLSPGQYATSVLRELVQLETAVSAG